MAAKRKSEGASDAKSKKSKSTSKPKPEEPSALPEPLEAGDDEAAAAPEKETPKKKDAKKDTPKKEKKDKKAKKEKETKSTSKKRKADEVELTNGDDNTEEAAAEAKKEKGDETAADAPPKAKKNKKAKTKATPAEGDEAAAAEEDAVAEGGKKEKANRFIVFVGNLPYTANAATIRQHFASVKPDGVRCLTKDGKENTCRGFAFIEFNQPTNMRTCLDKLHHSIFNDGLSPARKINVELTAGGGGNKSTARKEKIKTRNAELEVNRAKRIQKENDQKRANATSQPTDDDGIHPSRRKQMAP